MTLEHCRLVLQTSRGEVDRLAFVLEELGSVGWQEEVIGPGAVDRQLVAYFPAGEMAAVGAVDWRRRGARRVSLDRLGQEDWMARYRELSAPSALGGRFFVDPREPGAQPIAAPEGRALLRLPARQAFGTGSHESTRLAVELMEECPLVGASVLDVGTGTGILAFVARALGARRVTAFDIDPAATFAAQENQTLNRIRFAQWCGTLEALAERERFDLIAANIRPERLAGRLRPLAAHLGAGGRLLLSGWLSAERRLLDDLASECSLEPVAQREVGEWSGWLLRGRA